MSTVPEFPSIVIDGVYIERPSNVISWDGNLTVTITYPIVDTYAAPVDAVVKAHVPDNTLYFDDEIGHQLETTARTGWKDLGNWSTWEAQQAQDYVNAEILNGMDQTQIDAWIDANITGSNVPQLRAQVITALKLLAGNLITLRTIVGIIAKVSLYIRDILIKRL